MKFAGKSETWRTFLYKRDHSLKGLGSSNLCVTSKSAGKHQTGPGPLLIILESGGNSVRGGEECKVKQRGPTSSRTTGPSEYLLTTSSHGNSSECNGPCFTSASQISHQLLFWKQQPRTIKSSIIGQHNAQLNQFDSKTNQQSKSGDLHFHEIGHDHFSWNISKSIWLYITRKKEIEGGGKAVREPWISILIICLLYSLRKDIQSLWVVVSLSRKWGS